MSQRQPCTINSPASWPKKWKHSKGALMRSKQSLVRRIRRIRRTLLNDLLDQNVKPKVLILAPARAVGKSLVSNVNLFNGSLGLLGNSALQMLS